MSVSVATLCMPHEFVWAGECMNVGVYACWYVDIVRDSGVCVYVWCVLFVLMYAFMYVWFSTQSKRTRQLSNQPRKLLF